MNKDKIKELSKLIDDFSTDLVDIFSVELDKAFMAATFILSENELPYLSNFSKENNDVINNYYQKYKANKYSPNEIRRAFSEAYLLSLREKENYTVNVTLELPMLYLKAISEVIVKHLEYRDINILNALGNIGTLACMLSISETIDYNNLKVTVNDEKEERIATNLRNLVGFSYEISTNLPTLSYRTDLIISDPFLRKVEDILIFFEDYVEYLNQNGYMAIILPTDFIRSRVFSDLITDHKLVLLGLVEYPSDLLEGLISSSIVILEKKNETNKEFFHAIMPSIKDIEGNIKCINNVIDYLKKYMED